MAIVTHPDPQILAAFALGRLAEPQRSDVEFHVATCDECCRRMEHASGDSLLALAQQAMATAVAGLGETIGSTPALPPELQNHPRYLVLDQLGAGGMGVVFKAEHRIMGRTVALKVLNGRMMSKAGAVGRFRREVRLASRLSHPNIVTAYDADEAGGHHFLVMEYVEGMSLDQLVTKRGPLSVTMACHFIRQAALGLKHAHEKGMIHRDIKPHNLMVTPKGQVKVHDFGLACVARGDDEELTSATAAKMTSPDMVLGTPDFLSPEQARSSATVDGRTDIYSLGCTLFFLLTGRPPFGGTQPFDKLIAHVQDPVPVVRASRADVPAALSDLLQRMMAKDPAERPQSPTEVAAALAPFARATPAPVAALVLDATPVVVATPIIDGPASETVEGVAEHYTDVAPKRLRKPKKLVRFYQKHRAALIAGILGLGLLLAAGVFGVLHPWLNDLPADPTGTETSPASVPSQRGPGTSPGSPQNPPPATSAGSDVLIVLPVQNVWGPDFDPLYDGLRGRGLSVSTASLTRAPCSRHADRPGPAIKPDHALKDVDPSKFGCVIFVGANVNAYLPGGAGESMVRGIIDDMKRRRKPIVGICLGMRVLIENGYLDGLPAARPLPQFQHLFQNQKVVWRDWPITVTDQFVTARSDREAEELATKLPEHLKR